MKHPVMIPLTLLALAPAPALAGVVEPADTSTAINIDVVVSGSVICIHADAAMTVVSGSGCADDPALTDMDDTCPTAEAWCGFGQSNTIRGGSDDDTLTIEAPVGTLTSKIILRGRDGDDTLEVLKADDGNIELYGDGDQDTYLLGDGTTLFVGEDAWVRVGEGSNDSGAGETYTLDMDVEGHVTISGTHGPDLMTLSGTITADSDPAQVNLKGRGGDDTFDLSGVTISGTSSGRAVLSLQGSGGADAISLTGELYLDTFASALIELGSGDGDNADMTGDNVVLVGLGGQNPIQQEVRDSAYMSLYGGTGSSDTLTGSSLFIMSGGARLNTWGWEYEN